MPTELEELVEFLHHGNTQIRQIAVENLVGFSSAQPKLFKSNQFAGVKDLKLLVKDYPPIAKNALIMLINLSTDQDVLNEVATDDTFLESILLRITNPKEPNADEIAMLLANMAKDARMKRLLNLKRSYSKDASQSEYAMDQLMDCFVKGADGSFNKHTNFEHLSYLFADFAMYPEGREYFSTPRTSDSNIIPLTKLIVFTEHRSEVLRRGVASTIKNVAFDVPLHEKLVSSDPMSGIHLLPYLLLPLMGPEEYPEEDTEGMLDEVQLLAPDKEREKCVDIIKTHLETLLLLTTTSDTRHVLKQAKLYPIIREVHLQVEDEEVREVVDRLVQVIMRDEGADEKQSLEPRTSKIEEIDSDEEITEVL